VAWIPNVNPSELIESAWGNTIRDHVVNTFASATERAAAVPTPTPGMVSYLADTGKVEVYTARTTPSSWRPPWSSAWGLVQDVAVPDLANVGGVVFVPGATVTATTVVGRNYRLEFAANLAKDGIAGATTVRFQRGASPGVPGIFSQSPGWINRLAYADVYPGGVDPVQTTAECNAGLVSLSWVRLRAFDVGPN
jgi:hypothetical protein